MPNPIKIYSVVSKGCIFFDGSTVQPKFLGTILCEPHPTLSDRVIVYRTDRQSRTDSAAFRTIFRKLKIGRIQNVLGEYLVDDLGYDRDQVIAYVNGEANKTDVVTSGQSFAVGSSLDFIRDETNTSILFSNGDHYGVNAVRAELKENGLIGIFPARGDVELYEVDHSIVTINSTTPAGDAQSVVNSLNALFTMSATPAPFPIPTFSLDDGEDITPLTIDTGIDTDGMIRNLTDGTKYHGPRLYTGQTLNQPGEYFTFEALNTVAGGGPLLGLGLYDANSDDISEIGDDSLSNSGTHGYWWSVWLYNYNGYTSPWTTYGSNSGLGYGPGWNGSTSQQFRYSDAEKGFRSPENAPAKFRVGITDEGFVGVWYYDQENASLSHGYGPRSNDWILLARSSAPLPSGEYGLLVKLPTDSIQILPNSFERFALADPAPTLFYRYIESPDGVFHYPLFSSAEEANYVSSDGQSHVHIYPDDPTNTTWYMPGAVHGDDTTVYAVEEDPDSPDFGRPLNVNSITWTEIPSLTNADQTPPAFSGYDLTVDEGGSVNYQTQPQDTNYVTTFSGLPVGLIDANGGMVQGSAPEVADDNVTNPSDTYSVTVTRTNSYGSSTGTFNIIVNNLTAPIVAPISGVTFLGGTPMTDADTMGDGSAVAIDNVVDDGNRLVLDKEWLDNVVLPAITSGTGTKAVLVGFPNDNADWSSVTAADFKSCYMFYATDASRAANNWRLRGSLGGANNNDVGIGSLTDGLYDCVFINDGDTIQQGALVASEGHDASTTEFEYATLPWRWTLEQSGHGAGSKQMVIATSGCELDLDLSYFNEYVEPTPAVANLTPWTKALDFSGSSERAQMVSTSYAEIPMKMGGLGFTVDGPSDLTKTSDKQSSRPWATAIVFRADRHNSNQHIWNLGEGAGNNDDNIYLRMDAIGNLYFGWGRDNGQKNECALGQAPSSTGWQGVYIGSNGTRLSASDATSANLADAFSIRKMGSEWAQPFGALGAELSTSGNWVTTGGRMDRAVSGELTIGGRGSNRSFHGKVASFVSTTLLHDSAVPSDAEIELMITDPKKWLQDYKVSQPARPTSNRSTFNFTMNNSTSAYATQVWLMGDGSSDSYSNMIRNDVWTSDQNYTKLNLISMQSNDIQNVTIPGLSD